MRPRLSTMPASTFVPPTSMPTYTPSPMSTILSARRAARSVARQVGGADQAGGVAQSGQPEVRDRAVLAAGEVADVRRPHRLPQPVTGLRSEERRVGKECVST